MKAACIGLIVVGLAGCATQTVAPTAEKVLPLRPAAENINSTLWMQTAFEYPAVARQIYALAISQLPDAVKAGTAYYQQFEPAQQGDVDKRPLAIILDLDETVIDNSAYQASLVKGQKFYSSPTWHEWTSHVEDYRAVPGAREFLQRVEKDYPQISIFYVSNRSCAIKDGIEEARNCPQLRYTMQWMKQEKLPRAADENAYLFGYEQWGSATDKFRDGDKTARRKFIADEYRIIMMVGDQMTDFVDKSDLGNNVTKPEGPAQKLKADKVVAQQMGFRWFLLPNPSYGSWYTSLPKECVDPESGQLKNVDCYNNYLSNQAASLRGIGSAQ